MVSAAASKLYSRPFFMMAFANFFLVASFGGFFMFPLFLIHHGGSKADIGIVMGVFALSSVLCRPWISEMVDRIGRKRSFALGCAIMTLMPLTYLFLKGHVDDFYIPLMIIRFCHGVGLAVCFTSSFTFIADIIPEKRLNEGIGMFGVTALAAMAVGPAAAEVLIRGFGFPLFFFSTSAMAGLGFLLHLPLEESYSGNSLESSVSFFSVLRRRKIRIVALLAFLFGFGLAASGGFVSPFARERAIEFISLYYISYSFAAVITRLLGGRVADRIGEERVIPPALILTGTGLWVIMLLGGSGVLVTAGLMCGCGHGFLFPCLTSLAVRNEPEEIRGKIIGTFTGSIDAGALAGSVLLGYLGEVAGYSILFLGAGLALFAGFVVYKLGPMRDNRSV